MQVKDQEKVEFNVTLEGLSCPSCAAKIEGVLRREKGVESATVSVAAGKVRVKYDPRLTTSARFNQILAGFGFLVQDRA
ncbi:MAG: heavy-metal-associated domain-containing protein [Firmicutes bacterium]|nr:heavy-metal-associated domain-containing protein [Bacillota bacterium]